MPVYKNVLKLYFFFKTIYFKSNLSILYNFDFFNISRYFYVFHENYGFFMTFYFLIINLFKIKLLFKSKSSFSKYFHLIDANQYFNFLQDPPFAYRKLIKYSKSTHQMVLSLLELSVYLSYRYNRLKFTKKIKFSQASM